MRSYSREIISLQNNEKAPLSARLNNYKLRQRSGVSVKMIYPYSALALLPVSPEKMEAVRLLDQRIFYKDLHVAEAEDVVFHFDFSGAFRNVELAFCVGVVQNDDTAVLSFCNGADIVTALGEDRDIIFTLLAVDDGSSACAQAIA